MLHKNNNTLHNNPQKYHKLYIHIEINRGKYYSARGNRFYIFISSFVYYYMFILSDLKSAIQLISLAIYFEFVT